MGSSIDENKIIYANTFKSHESETSPIIRALRLKSDSPLAKEFMGQISSLSQLFKYSVDKFKNKNLLGTRKVQPNGELAKVYFWKTYLEVDIITENLSKNIEKKGLVSIATDETGSIKNIGIYSRNREEWMITEIACWKLGCASVALYDTLGDDSIIHICEQTKMKTIFLESRSLSKIIQLRDRLPTIQNVVIFDEIQEADNAKTMNAHLNIIKWPNIIENCNDHEHCDNLVSAESAFTICYTSGTTNLPKGVVLTHKSAVAVMQGIKESRLFDSFEGSFIHLSYLPLAHCYERAVCYYSICTGGSIAFFGGNTQKIVEDIVIAKPTVFVAVPRVLNRIYDTLMKNFEELSCCKKCLLNRALDSKVEEYKKTGNYSHCFYDTFVFSQVRERFGGNIKVLITGSAPLDKEILLKMKVILSCIFIEGFGQTENFAIGTVDHPNNIKLGSIGVPISCCEMCLKSVPDMGYNVSDNPPRGELCIRGNNVMSRYFKLPEETRNAIDAQGWLHTGDIGTLNNNNTISIIDRKKNLFKLSQGEYVSPEKVEIAYSKCKYVSQVFVYGDSTQDFCVAIVVPNFDRLKDVMQGKTPEEICLDKSAAEFVLSEMKKEAEKSKLNSLEMAKKVRLTTIQFTIENNTLTPTQKLKRNEAKALHIQAIKEMYAEGLPRPEEKQAGKSTNETKKIIENKEVKDEKKRGKETNSKEIKLSVQKSESIENGKSINEGSLKENRDHFEEAKNAETETKRNLVNESNSLNANNKGPEEKRPNS